MPRKEMITLESVRTLKVMKAGSPILLPRAMRILQDLSRLMFKECISSFIGARLDKAPVKMICGIVS